MIKSRPARFVAKLMSYTRSMVWFSGVIWCGLIDTDIMGGLMSYFVFGDNADAK